jgi:hypothetical protein
MGMANRIERLQGDFLRGGIGDEIKFHLVNWKRICTLLNQVGWEFAT